MEQKILLYTDGACSNNGNRQNNRGGWAYVAVNELGNKITEKADEVRNTTNNRMELMAVIEGLKAFYKERVIVYTDSMYIVNCINDKWYAKWQTNGWKTKKGDVQNKDLWKTLLALVENFKDIEFKHVKGHSGNVFNEQDDTLATSMCVSEFNLITS